MKLRFIGGSEHGKVRDIRAGDSRVCVALKHDDYGVYFGSPFKYNDPLYCHFRTEEYVRTPVSFENSCRIDVMVLSTLSRAAMWRRIADLVEGV